LVIQLSDNPVNRDRGFRICIPGKDLSNNVRFDGIYLHSASSLSEK